MLVINSKNFIDNFVSQYRLPKIKLKYLIQPLVLKLKKASLIHLQQTETDL
jgi:hypothetical protein